MTTSFKIPISFAKIWDLHRTYSKLTWEVLHNSIDAFDKNEVLT